MLNTGVTFPDGSWISIGEHTTVFGKMAHDIYFNYLRLPGNETLEGYLIRKGYLKEG